MPWKRKLTGGAMAVIGFGYVLAVERLMGQKIPE